MNASTRRTPLLLLAHRGRAIVPLVMGAIVAASMAVVAIAAPASAVAPSVSVTLTGGQILAGEEGEFSLSATNSGATDGYNLALYLDVPVGIDFVSSTLGSPKIYTELDPPDLPLAPGMQRWVWQDVSDLPAGGSYGGSVTVLPAQPPMGGGDTLDAVVSPVGSTFTLTGHASLSGDPTYLPVFNGSTGVGTAPAIAETGTSAPAVRTVNVVSLTIDKSEPSPEAELMRGIHNQTTVYTLRVRATTEGVTENSVLVDYLPAGLEFLGCATDDFSTVDRAIADIDINEYEGAPPLSAVADVTSNCLIPASIATIVADASLTASHGLAINSVYTRVTWNLGTLAPGSLTTIRYAAGIPLRENTVTWEGPEPTPASLHQAANLDNNNGPSTRHGTEEDHEDGRVWTNAASVAGDYQGVVRTGAVRAVGDVDTQSVHAMDLAVLKDVDGADEQFVVGNIADFTLTLRASEYMSSDQIVLTDEIPNGLCPLLPAGLDFTLDPGATVTPECEAAGTVTGAEMVSATAHTDGTFTVVLRPTDGGDPDDFVLAPDAEHEITYQALNRGEYVTAAEYGSTTSGDSFGNVVEVRGSTHAIDPIVGDYPETYLAWDDSGESLATDLTTISKRVLPRADVEQDLAPGEDPCTLGTFSNDTEGDFRLGDTVCFELRVDFPSSIDVRNPVVTDFLPNGLTYVGHAVAASSTVDPGAVDVNVTGATAGRIEWELGTLGAGGDLYVPRGRVFVAHIWATVDAPSNGIELDKPQNLMKYRQENVHGELYFLRDAAQIEVDPELQLLKGVESVLANGGIVYDSTRTATSEGSAEGQDFLSNRDGILVREGEMVRYRIDLHGLPYDATAGEVWDLLPAGVAASDVSAISDGGVAYDPSDAGHPAGDGDPLTELPDDLDDRSIVIWKNVPVPSGEKTLNYDVEIPLGTGADSSLENTASIITYRSGINTSSDPAAQLYIPDGSLNVALEEDANTDGEGTTDDSDVYLPTVTVDKTQTSPVLDNNSSGQVVPGELADFTYSVTIPAYTSVLNGTLRDIISGASNWEIASSESWVSHPGGSTAPGSGIGFIIGGFDPFSFNPGNGRLDFPAVYSNATGSPQTFTVHLTGYIKPSSSWTHSTSTARTDIARFDSASTGELDADEGVYLVEPSPSLAKLVNDDTVTAGQVLTYTLTASNASSRPTLFDTVVTDCVPTPLVSVTAGTASQGGAYVTTDPGCEGSLVVWEAGSIAGGASATLTYTATVTSAAAGAATYTNNASLTGYSLDNELDDRRSYTATATETVTVVSASIAKAVNVATATIGQERTFTVTATLPANVNFYDAAIIDIVPTTMSISGASIACTDSASGNCIGDLPGGGAAMTVSGTNHGWWLGDVASGPLVRTVTVTYTGTVLNQVGTVSGTTIQNRVRLRWNIANTLTTAPDASFTGTATTSQATRTVTVQAPTLTTAKVVNGLNADVVDPGDGFSYTVTVANTGTSAAYDVTVTDDIPEGVVVNAGTISHSGVLSGAGANGGGTITWTLTSISTSANTVLTYSATLADSDQLDDATLTNTATVDQYFSHPTGPGYSTPERRTYTGAAADAEVTPGFPDPRIAKTVGGGTVAYIGEAKTFTLTITNPGDGPATNVVVVDDLPVGFEYVAGSTTVNTAAAADPGASGSVATGQELTWDALPDVAVNATLVVTYQARPAASHTWTSLNTGADVAHSNTVTVTADDTADFPENAERVFTDDATSAVYVHEADLSVTKSHTGQIVAGSATTWSVTVTNNGPDPAVGPIVITDTLPDDAEYGSISGTGWSVVSYDSGTQTLVLTHAGPLAASASSTVSITVAFADDVADGTDADNAVCVDARTFDPDPTNDCATDPGDVVTLADVELDKALVGSDYVAGEDISWTLDVTNNGPSVSQSPFTLKDTLSAKVDWETLSYSGTGWSCGSADLLGVVECTWTGSALGVGDNLPRLTLTAEVLPSATGTLVNTATVTPTTAEPLYPGASNNTDTVTTGAVGTEADLGIVKSVDSDELVAGGSGRYRVEVTNDGPSDALNVIVTDSLPAGLTYAGGLTSAPGDTWTCTPSGIVTGQVDCELSSNLGTLVDGGATWFEFDVDIASSVVDEVVNTALVSSDTDDPNPDNDEDDATQDPFVQTNVTITKTHDDSPVYRSGDEVTFTIEVENTGVADAADVVVTDVLPAGTAFARSENDTGWSVVESPTGTLTLTLDDPLPSGASGNTASIDIVVTLDDDAVPGFTNVVTVVTSTDETDDNDNDASEPVEVDTPDLEIVKTADTSLTEGGDTFTYTLTVSNVDDDARADDVVVTDDLPYDVALQTDPDDIGGTDWACTLTGEDIDGFGGTLTCTLATLAADATATALVFDVLVAADVARDVIPNTADVASDDEHASQVDEANEDDTSVDVKWINFSADSICVNDVPWFQYMIDARNLDDDLPITLTWYPDADADGVPDGPAIAVQTLTAETGSGVVNDQILWPGAAVDEHGVGIAWPGWRPVIAGETPDWQNQIEDPALPEWALRAGALVVVEINPESDVHASYPPATPDCEVVRNTVLDVDKSASGLLFTRGQAVLYTLSVSNVAYGATDDVVLTDPIPASLKVLTVEPAPSTDPAIADWQDCTVSGQDADGFGGTVECVLDGWLGEGQTAPDVVITALIKPGSSLGRINNVAIVSWTDPGDISGDVLSADSDADITVVLSAAELLALTGLEAWGVLWIAVLLLGIGGVLMLISRRRQHES